MQKQVKALKLDKLRKEKENRQEQMTKELYTIN